MEACLPLSSANKAAARLPWLPSPPHRARLFRQLPLVLLTWLMAACTPPTQQEALFCPADGCASRLIAEIDEAQASVHVAIAYFNHADIAQALIEAHERGVDVKVLGEAKENQPGGINYTAVQMLLSAGVPYRDDANPDIMHDKFAIIDGAVVLTGSFNYTYAADERNNENLVVLVSSKTADAFETEFDYLWTYGTTPSSAESGEE